MIIYDRQYSPLIFHQDNVLYVPAESVYAVFDSKHQLTSRTAREASEKAASVRRLERTSLPVKYVEGTYQPKTPFEILGGILSRESSWAGGVGESLIWELQSLGPEGRLQLGCALRHGAFEVRHSASGSVTLETSTPETALIFFFVRLVHNLQNLGTVPALDLTKYAATLETRSITARPPKE